MKHYIMRTILLNKQIKVLEIQGQKAFSTLCYLNEFAFTQGPSSMQ